MTDNSICSWDDLLQDNLNENVRYWLWFIMAFKPGNERIWQLLSPFSNIKEAFDAVYSGNHPALNENDERKFKSIAMDNCCELIEHCTNSKYHIITFDNPNYPVLLRSIHNPPAVLFCLGDIRNFNDYPAISCVGTRRPSPYSLGVTQRVCAELVERHFTIVSGFALGIDSASHIAALQNGGRTVAVLACGLDFDYPKENAKYKRLIAMRNGLVLTEYLPNEHPTRSCFSTRNRIISGLTFGTVVFEAMEGSGSLITAEHAASQERTVFCIPPSDIFDKRYFGVVKHLREGAIPVYETSDIIQEYYRSRSHRMLSEKDISPESIVFKKRISSNKKNNTKRKNKSVSKNDTNAPVTNETNKTADNTKKREQILAELNEQQLAIVNCFNGNELAAEELIQLSGVDSMSIFSLFTELELSGIIKLQDSKKYALII